MYCTDNLSSRGLGVDPVLLGEMKKKITHVIHSAWAVNFNIPVQSFEHQHIQAVHNLISLCSSVETAQPAVFNFCSSVSAAGGSPRPGIVTESHVKRPEYAQKTGYARSKYVAEHITRNAMKDAGLPTRVLRIGQLAGDSKVGELNPSEGIPMMIQTAFTLGALPCLDEEMKWLPVDYTATAILQVTGLDNVDSCPSIHRSSEVD